MSEEIPERTYNCKERDNDHTPEEIDAAAGNIQVYEIKRTIKLVSLENGETLTISPDK
jgi:hypothetical protein